MAHGCRIWTQNTRQRSDELQRSLREAEESIRADLRQNAESLGHAKVDRISFGDMLVQLGDSLKDDQASGMAVDLIGRTHGRSRLTCR